MNWVLILWLHAGAMSNSDSMALTTVPGFKDEATCKVAGEAAVKMTTATLKTGKFVCVKQN